MASAGSALAEVHYVDVNSTNATPPYTNWTTAATSIQDAVDAAVAGDEVVVTNGTYARGGTNGNRVEVDKPLNVRNVNGPQVTVIQGNFFTRCAYLTNDASLSGFTLRGGYSPSGGGLVCEDSAVASNCLVVANSANFGGGASGGTLNKCTLTGNSAGKYYTQGQGGGAINCTLVNCSLTGNSARAYGGGVSSCTLVNCTLTGNSATESGGGAAYTCLLLNCIVYFNDAPSGANYDDFCDLGYSCTMPQAGIGNITNAPLFVDTNGWANLRLQPNSPCINAGNNSCATNATDLDGNPRISGGTVDIGAYEFQWPQLTITPSRPNVLLAWPTNNAGYDYSGFTLQSTTNLGSPAVWATNSPAPVVINGQNIVTNPLSGSQQFYRLRQ
jgi:hypothetical protein